MAISTAPSVWCVIADGHTSYWMHDDEISESEWLELPIGDQKMDWREHTAIIAIATVLAEHLEASEDATSNELLPSDRVRGAIEALVYHYDEERKTDV